MSGRHTGTFSTIDTASTEAFYRQIHSRFHNAIADGRQAPSDRFPSTRAQATESGSSRGTNETAYSTLIAEAHFQPRYQAGSFVTPGLNLRGVGASSCRHAVRLRGRYSAHEPGADAAHADGAARRPHSRA
jgi:DNA-binding transcriptional MocR family regulator